MDFEQYFHENLIIFLESDSKENLFKSMFGKLHENGFVKESYLNAIQERETIHPTGLQTETLGVAIPHTDHEHVIKEAIGVGLLNKPITFQHMGMNEVNVEVSVVFMLAIRKPDNQLGVLQTITGLIQDKEVLKRLSGCESEKEVLLIIEELSNSKV